MIKDQSGIENIIHINEISMGSRTWRWMIRLKEKEIATPPNLDSWIRGQEGDLLRQGIGGYGINQLEKDLKK